MLLHRLLVRAAVVAAAAAGLASPALAHGGTGHAHGLVDGFAHPLGGFDHLLAAVAVGLLASRLGGRALPLLPAAFMVAMAAGFGLATAGVGLPLVELAIALSVVLFGMAVAGRSSLPLPVLAAFVAAFAVFHGQAHGAEMPAGTSGLAYAAGFAAATGLLHLAGIALGSAIGRAGAPQAIRIAGGGVALAGLMLLAGVA